jgi:hypothetical protein
MLIFQGRRPWLNFISYVDLANATMSVHPVRSLHRPQRVPTNRIRKLREAFFANPMIQESDRSAPSGLYFVGASEQGRLTR